MRANGRTIRRQQLRSVAKRATKLMGCTCDPDYRVGKARALDNVVVAHDLGCPLYMAGQSFVIYDPRDVQGCER